MSSRAAAEGEVGVLAIEATVGRAASPLAAEKTGAPETPQPATRVGRNVTVLTIAQLITWTMALLWTLVVPRTLGPAGMGTIMAAWSLTGILGIVLGLGTRSYLVRKSVLDPREAPHLIGTTLVLRIVLSPLLLAAAAGYGEVVGWDHDAKVVLYLSALATVFVQVAEPMQAGFQSTERMEYLAYSDVISKSAQGLVGIVVVLLGFGTIGVTSCWTAMAAIVIVLDAYWLRGLVRVDLRTSLRRMVAVAKESLPYWAYGVFFMLYLWIDFVMLSLLTRPEVVGWYSVPTKLFQTLMFLPVVVSTAWLPRFVRGFEEGGDRLRRAAQAPLELVLLLSLPISAATAILAKPMIDLLYGPAYGNSASVMIILGLCVPPMYLNIMLSQVLVAMNRQVSWTWVMAATTVVNPLFNIALIPFTEHRYGNGAIGASISLLLTEVVVVTAGLVMVGPSVFDRGTVRRTVLGSLAAVAMWFVGYEAQPLGVMMAFAAAGFAFTALAIVLRLFTADDVALFRTSVNRMVRRILLLRPGKQMLTAAADVPPRV